MLAISLTAQGVFLVAALIVSARVTVRTRSIAKGGFCLYGLFVLGGLLFSVLLAGLLVGVTGDPDIGRAFPDAAGMMGIIFLSWIPAFAFVGVVWVFGDRFSRLPGVVRARKALSRLVRRVGLDAGADSSEAGREVYRKWVGVVLGFFLTGSAHFLSGHRRAGVAWFLSLFALALLPCCLIVVPGTGFYVATVLVWVLAVVLWVVMLKQSYRPVRRIGWLRWLAVFAIAVSLHTAEEWAARFMIHPFKITGDAMRPTVEGIRTREIPDGGAVPGYLARLVRGERYVRWQAMKSGTFKGPYPLPDFPAVALYEVEGDSRCLPRQVNMRFRHGDRVMSGNLIWSGMVVSGDHVIAEKVSYRLREPKRGEIVVFKTDGLSAWGPGTYLTFRIAGLPGERVRIHPPWLVVNGERVVDPPIFATIAAGEQGYKGLSWPDRVDGSPGASSKEVLLGDDEYFVLGDNASNAHDSRYAGPIPRRNIVGRVIRIYWPLHRIGALDGK